MFGFSIKTRNLNGPAAASSPRIFGTPKIVNSPAGVNSANVIGTPRETDSPIGEIDTKAPFASVKAAVSLFGEVSSPKTNKPLIKKTRSAEEVYNECSLTSSFCFLFLVVVVVQQNTCTRTNIFYT